MGFAIHQHESATVIHLFPPSWLSLPPPSPFYPFGLPMSTLLLHMLSRFVIAFLPRSKYILISCLQSPPTVILEAKKIKSVTPFTFLNPSESFNILSLKYYMYVYFPGGACGKESTCQCRRHKIHRFDPWVRKIHCRRARQPISVFFLPGESSWTEGPGGLQSIGLQEVEHNWSDLACSICIEQIKYCLCSSNFN